MKKLPNYWTEDEREDMLHVLHEKSPKLCDKVLKFIDPYFEGGGSYIVQESDDKLGVIADLMEDDDEIFDSRFYMYDDYDDYTGYNY